MLQTHAYVSNLKSSLSEVKAEVMTEAFRRELEGEINVLAAVDDFQ